MQSSTAIAIRALIMLIVLISVPLFAIFGKNLPEVFKGLLEGRGLVLAPAPGVPGNVPGATPLPVANNPQGQPGPFRAATDPNLRMNPAAVPASMPITNPSAASGIGGGALARAPALGASGGAIANPADGTNLQPVPLSPNPAAANDWRQPPAGPAASPTTPALLTNGAQPAAFQSPLGMPGNESGQTTASPQAGPYPTSLSPNVKPVTTGGGPIAPAPLPAAGDDKFRQAENRLRELGATHYMLETWGPDNNRYRFACKMSIGGNPGVNRYFQAIEDDPWQAMNAVLHQVEDWRGQPQQ